VKEAAKAASFFYKIPENTILAGPWSWMLQKPEGLLLKATDRSPPLVDTWMRPPPKDFIVARLNAAAVTPVPQLKVSPSTPLS